MCIGEAEVRNEFITQNPVFGHLGKQPNGLTLLQGASRFVGDTFAEQTVGEFEGISILNDAVFVGDDTENGVVRAADVSFVIWDYKAVNFNVFLNDVPIESCETESVCRGGSFSNNSSEFVPSGCTCKKSRFE